MERKACNVLLEEPDAGRVVIGVGVEVAARDALEGLPRGRAQAAGLVPRLRLRLVVQSAPAARRLRLRLGLVERVGGGCDGRPGRLGWRGRLLYDERHGTRAHARIAQLPHQREAQTQCAMQLVRRHSAPALQRLFIRNAPI